MPVLEIRELSYIYPGEESISFPDFSIQEKALIYGSSGVGKTTLLHLISGIKTLQRGEIVIDGTYLSQMNSKELEKFRAENIGIVFQKPFFISSLNVIENILIAGNFSSNSSKQKSRALELLERFGIASKQNKAINALSVGEQQRVSIARAFLNHPKLVIADEPSSALDDKNCNEVIKEMLSTSENYGTSFIVVSHDQRLHSFFNQKIELT